MPRVVFDDETINYSTVSSRRRHPQESLHWQQLNHQPGDRLLADRSAVLEAFQETINVCCDAKHDDKNKIIAVWSCLLGYSEALATHKDEQRRFDVYPVPYDALMRLIDDEFVPLMKDAASVVGTPNIQSAQQLQEYHRRQVQALSNAIWQQALPKPNVRDEVHANSVYVCLRGKNIDKKSLDCFGAAVTTVAGLQCCLDGVDNNSDDFEAQSFLTLSEDHAYEHHHVVSKRTGERLRTGTCEVAIPGTTKLAKSKRGREIVHTLENESTASSSSSSTTASTKRRRRPITPENSWLYMASNPVICTTTGMTLVAIVGNMNPNIDTNNQQSSSTNHRPALCSAQLHDLKRDLLWMLYDGGHMKRFPFGMMELGDCEEHRESNRGNELIPLSSLGFIATEESNTEGALEVTRNEQLFLEAMHINRVQYNEAQVYPYFYAGHFHKDAGKKLDRENEFRLVEAMYLYSRAAYVASRYPYHTGCIQLNKHMSTAAMLISQDMLTCDDNVQPKDNPSSKAKHYPRVWYYNTNAVAFGTWLIGFFDSLFFWEETSGESVHFVEILHPSHKHSMGRLLSLLSQDIRNQVLEKVSVQSSQSDPKPEEHPLIQCTSHRSLSYFGPVRSKRLSKGGLIWTALTKAKVSIPEMAFVIPTNDEEGEGEPGSRTSRRSKRPRR
jgi:hypothetical protein